MDAQRVLLSIEAAARPDLAFASALVEASETELAKRQQQAQTAEEAYREAEKIQTDARNIARGVIDRATRLKAEADALGSLLQHQDEKSEKLIDLITVTPGLEHALAVALGEALTAALDEKAPIYWRELPPLGEGHALPQGIAPISKYIQAPTALGRSLSQIGLVEDAATGAAAAANLRPGQIIVSRDGWAWRWDGFTVTPEAKTATAVRLQQRNRLAALKEEIADAEFEVSVAEEALSTAADNFVERQHEEREARDALKAAFAALNDARSAYSQQEKEATALTTKLATLDETLNQVNQSLVEIKERLEVIDVELEAVADVESKRAVLSEKRASLAEKRNQQANAQGEFNRLNREQNIIKSRRASITSETQAWYLSRARVQ